MPRLTADDLATRHEGLGATDIVEIAGLAPWEDAGPWHVFNQKTGVTPPTPPTEEQSWGHTQELVIASWYLTNVGEFHDVGKVYHPSIPYIWATLDGLRPDRTVEIKNVSGFMAKHWSVGDPDGVPHYVRGQVQIGMRCARREECHVVASLAGRPPEVWTVRYDATLCDMLEARAVKFWTGVASRTPPPVDASDAVRAYLRATYPSDERPMQIASGEVEGLARLRREASVIAKVNADMVKELDSKLMIGLTDAKGWEGDGWKFTWKKDKNGRRATRFTWNGGDDE